MGIFLVFITCVIVDLTTLNLIPQITRQVIASTTALVAALAGSVNSALSPFVQTLNAEIKLAENRVNGVIVGIVDDTAAVLNNTVGVLVTGFNQDIKKALNPVAPLANALESFGSCVVSLDSVLQSLEEVKSVFRVEFPGVDADLIKIEDLSSSIRNAVENDEAVERLEDWIIRRAHGLVERLKDALKATLWSFYFTTAFGLMVFVLGVARVSVWW